MTARICTRTGAKWKLPRYKRDWRSICAVLPAYLEDGTNGTMVVFLNGETETVASRLQWVLDDLLGYLGTSKAVLGKQSRVYLGKNARRVPLIVSSEFCLVPVKGRETVLRYDGRTGYLVLEHVEDIIPDGEKNKVYFMGDCNVSVYDSRHILWKNLYLARELKKNMESRFSG